MSEAKSTPDHPAPPAPSHAKKLAEAHAKADALKATVKKEVAELRKTLDGLQADLDAGAPAVDPDQAAIHELAAKVDVLDPAKPAAE